MQVILATDADHAGGNLAEELSRRLKRHRCKITVWPSGWHDHLVYMDMDSVAERVNAFETVRPSGLISYSCTCKPPFYALCKHGCANAQCCCSYCRQA